ncbi:myb/SANT-like DNA-binding domain-containing protein 3 [Colias croceus]|uniref:myb/SANT-like DNA-binding domain-containing protein 3 n=2 Tax=Colias crocea TaxID=72248 RepID=UPI001E27E895|nr:myb/SANT-like DNA-binding domain-containing protein 3 [Colias croceus]
MNNMMKKSRGPNFSTAEIMHLLKLVEKYPIIENKRTDGATAKDKQMAWQRLTAEYNSQTNFSPRTADKLLSCYKNQKVKVKKMHSNEKMAIRAPLLLNAVEEYGQDWNQVAQATEASSLDCKNTFEELVKDAKREEALHKKEINRTGGGPPPESSGSRDPVIEKVKTIIGPSLEGLYTIYDGDAEFMKEQQESASINTEMQPIDMIVVDSPQVENGNDDKKRLNIMKRKVDPSLESLRKGKKQNVSHSFKELAEDKKDLVKAQKELAELQIEHQKILIKLAQEKLQFEEKKNKMELEYLKEKYALELNKKQ